MVGWHYWLKGHEFEQTLGDSEGLGGLACCSPWGHKQLDMTERLNNDNKLLQHVQSPCQDCASRPTDVASFSSTIHLTAGLSRCRWELQVSQVGELAPWTQTQTHTYIHIHTHTQLHSPASTRPTTGEVREDGWGAASRLVRGNTDWSRPPWPGTIVTICMSCFTTGGAGKECGISKPPPTRRITGKVKRRCHSSYQPPRILLAGIHLGWVMPVPAGRTLSQTDWPETTGKLIPSP